MQILSGKKVPLKEREKCEQVNQIGWKRNNKVKPKPKLVSEITPKNKAE